MTRIAYRAPGAPNVHPLDAALNLPEEKRCQRLRSGAAAGSARGSFVDAAAAIARDRGETGKRQVERARQGVPRHRRGRVLRQPQARPGA